MKHILGKDFQNETVMPYSLETPRNVWVVIIYDKDSVYSTTILFELFCNTNYMLTILLILIVYFLHFSGFTLKINMNLNT